jgi:hypothetical protein
MSVISAFHTLNTKWSHEGVYHDNDQCLRGSSIPARDRVTGRGGNCQCSECAWHRIRDAEKNAEHPPLIEQK